MYFILLVFIALVLFYFKLSIENRAYTLYALALVVSIVGVNIHLGITFYLSRIVLILFFLSVIFKKIQFNIKPIWLEIPVISISVQILSTLFSERISSSTREIFIYLSCILIFWITIILCKSIVDVKRALRFYLFTGFVQAIYGIYQLFGYTRNWPTYQTVLSGVPMANDRTVDGYFYTGAYSAFRSIGFFSTDVSHFAGYMAGVLILTLSFIIINKKAIGPYFLFVLGIMSLFFSLSRSGIVSFFVFGIPTLFLLLRWQNLLPVFRIFNSRAALALVVLLSILGLDSGLFEDLPNPYEILTLRFEDVLDQNNDGSMGEHVFTRKLGLDAFRTHPVLGVGSGVNAIPWYSESFQAKWAGSHSYHIDRLGQNGVLGLLIEWLLMFYILVYMLKGIKVKYFDKSEKILLIGLFATYFTIVLGNFLYYYYMNDFVWFIMGLGVALSRLMLIKDHNCRIS